MSGPTIYVHVGCRKTGTSYLQKAVYTSRETLAEQGIGLPLPDRGAHYRLVTALRELEGGPVSDASRDVLDHLTRTLQQMTTDRAVITHEALAPATPVQVEALLDALRDCEVHVVVTARDLARQIPSEWQQTVKERAVVPYADFCQAVMDGKPEAGMFWARQDVVDVTARWSAGLPPERVHVVPVPPSGSPPGLLLGQFCGLIGCDPASLVTPGGQNPSLGAEQAELLRRVNVALGDRLSDVRGGYRDVVRGTLAKQVLSQQRGAPLLLPDRLREWAREESRARVVELEARGYDIVGRLEDLVPAELVAGAGESAPEVTDAEVAEAAVQALASLSDRKNTEMERERQAAARGRGRREAAATPRKKAAKRPPPPPPTAWSRARGRLGRLRRRLGAG